MGRSRGSKALIDNDWAKKIALPIISWFSTINTKIFEWLATPYMSQKLTPDELALKNQIADIIQQLATQPQSGLSKNALLNNWKKVSDSTEIAVVGFILNLNISNEDKIEFLKGGQFWLQDDDREYQKWVMGDGSDIKRRFVDRQNASSHRSKDHQYGFAGPFVKEILFGDINIPQPLTKKSQTIDQGNYTWLQLESAATGPLTLLQHMWSFLRYFRTGKNQGPYGESIYTDNNPKVITKKEIENSMETMPEYFKPKVGNKNSYQLMNELGLHKGSTEAVSRDSLLEGEALEDEAINDDRTSFHPVESSNREETYSSVGPTVK